MAVGKAALGKVEDITRAILVLRGRQVLLDAELAVLYGVTRRRLNEQVRRNRKRFPDDFLFELTTEEFANLKSRFATSSWGGRRKRPLAFTEHVRWHWLWFHTQSSPYDRVDPLRPVASVSFQVLNRDSLRAC
jgi:hypothetical protein